jgi:hypothetical protein
MSLGQHGKLTTDEARKLAVVTLGGVLQGEDPAEERATRRKSLTVRELCERYLEAADKGLILGKRGQAKKASTLVADRSRIGAHVLPLIGNKKVSDLTRADMTRFMRDGLRPGPWDCWAVSSPLPCRKESSLATRCMG